MKKKAVILLAGLFALLGAACLSMARVMHGEEYVAAARAQSLYKLDIAQSRGTIYDCGLQPLVGGETEYVAAVAPTIQAIGALEKATGGQYRQQLAVALENGRPFQLVLEQPVDNPLVQVFRVPQRYSQEQLAALLESDIAYGDFFRQAPAPHPNRGLITGSVCGVKVEAIQDPLLREIRYLDKLVDELAKGKPLEKVLRQG